MNESGPRVGAIVVNFNSGRILLDCVRALLAANADMTVTVIDNASGDDSMALLASEAGDDERLKLRFNENNEGFASAVNSVARSEHAEYLLVINPDCELQAGALGPLMDALSEDARAALAGPKIRDGAGRLEAACLRHFPRPWNSLVTLTGLWRLGRWIPGLRGIRPPAVDEITGTMEAEATSGACMLLRRRALADVGFFDEAYALHCEDLDLMYRLRQAGWRSLFVPAAQAVHHQGISSRSRPLWVHWQKHRGMWRFYRKLLSAEYPAAVTLLVATGIWAHYLVRFPLVWLRK